MPKWLTCMHTLNATCQRNLLPQYFGDDIQLISFFLFLFLLCRANNNANDEHNDNANNPTLYDNANPTLSNP